jgi:hypothetical protein
MRKNIAYLKTNILHCRSYNRILKFWNIYGMQKTLCKYMAEMMTRDSSASVVTGYGLDGRGVGVRVPVGAGFISALHSVDSFRGPSGLLSNWAISLGVKRPGRETDHSPPTSIEVKNTWIYTSTPPKRVAARSKGTNCLRSLEHWDRGFESHSRHGCLYCLRLSRGCAVLCLGRGLATLWSRVQVVLQTVYRNKNMKSGQGSTKGCRAIIIIIHPFPHTS